MTGTTKEETSNNETVATPTKETPASNSTQSSPSKKDIDIATQALNHYAQGKRHYLVNDINSAVNSLQEACRLLAEHYGETAPECGDAYFYYGKALLELARIENGVLGNALDGVPEGDDENNSQVEDPEKLTEEEKDMVSEIVGEALEENYSENEKQKPKSTKEDAPTTEQAAKSEEKDVVDGNLSSKSNNLLKGEEVEFSKPTEEVQSNNVESEEMETDEAVSGDSKKEKVETSKEPTEDEEKMETDDSETKESSTESNKEKETEDKDAEIKDTEDKNAEQAKDATDKQESKKVEDVTEKETEKEEIKQTDKDEEKKGSKETEDKVKEESKENDKDKAKEESKENDKDNAKEESKENEKDEANKEEPKETDKDAAKIESDENVAKEETSSDDAVKATKEDTKTESDKDAKEESTKKETPKDDNSSKVEDNQESTEKDSKSNSKESSESLTKEKTDEKMEVGDEKPENEKKDCSTEDEEEKEGDSQDDEGEEGEDEAEAAQENGEASEEPEGEKTEDSEEEEVGNLQLAWEMLELAKVIYSKQKEIHPSMNLKIAQVYLKLGEVCLESENYPQSIADFQNCLDIQLRELSHDDRCLAETHYQMGVAYCFSDDFDKAIASFSSAAKVIEDRIANVERQKQEKLSWTEEQKKKDARERRDPFYTEQGEIDELAALLPDIKERIVDMEEMKKDTKEKIQKIKDATFANLLGGGSKATDGASSSGETSIGFSNTSETSSAAKTDADKPATNITHLIRKKRKPEEEADKDDAKKAKGESGEEMKPPTSVNGTKMENGSPDTETPMEVKVKEVSNDSSSVAEAKPETAPI